MITINYFYGFGFSLVFCENVLFLAVEAVWWTLGIFRLMIKNNFHKLREKLPDKFSQSLNGYFVHQKESIEHQTGTCQLRWLKKEIILTRQRECCTRDSLFTWRNQKLHSLGFPFLSSPTPPSSSSLLHVHSLYAHHNRQQSGINILVQVFMSLLAAAAAL